MKFKNHINRNLRGPSVLTLEGMKKKKLNEGMRRGVNGVPLYFQKYYQPIDMKFGMCNNCPVYFQLSIVTWHLVGFHGNRSIEMTFPSVKINDIYPIDIKSI